MDDNIKKSIVNNAIEYMQTLVNYQGDFITELATYDTKQQLQTMLELYADISFIQKRIDIPNLEPLELFDDYVKFEVNNLDYTFLKETVSSTNLQGHAIFSGYGDIIIKDEQNFVLYQDSEHYILVLDNHVMEYSVDNVLQFLGAVVQKDANPMNKNLSKRFMDDFKNICLCTIFLDDFPKMPMLYKSRIYTNPQILEIFKSCRKQALTFPKGKQIIAYNCFWERLEAIDQNPN